MNRKFKRKNKRILIISVLILILLAVCPWESLNSTNNTSNQGLTELKPDVLSIIAGPLVTSEKNLDKNFHPKAGKFPKEGIPVLMYHSISTVPGNTLCVPVKQFSEEMEWLRSRNYHTISVDELYRALVDKTPVPEKPIVLTFDDGYLDGYKSAWPIMRKTEFTGTFFIITNAIGSGMMSWSQLGDLSGQGNSIGSHSVHHFNLSKITPKQQESELVESKKTIDTQLRTSIRAFCFPSGRYNETTLQIMRKAGYKLGFTTKYGRVRLGDNPLKLKRLRIPGGMPIENFKLLFP